MEDACRTEVSKSDIIISIIANHSGTLSLAAAEEQRWASISRMEVEHAVALNIQLFCFVDIRVWHEYELWRRQEDEGLRQAVKWCSVDGPCVFEFIQFIRGLERNKAIFTYDGYHSIISILRAQIAGLLQDLLQQRSKQQLSADVNRLVQAIAAAENVTRYLEKQSAAGTAAVEDILMTRHPLFQRLQSIVRTEARIFFETMRELEAVLSVHGFHDIDVKQIPVEVAERYHYWTRATPGVPREYLGVPLDLFVKDESEHSGGYRLGTIDRINWRDESVVVKPPSQVDIS